MPLLLDMKTMQNFFLVVDSFVMNAEETRTTVIREKFGPKECCLQDQATLEISILPAVVIWDPPDQTFIYNNL